ncbi:hypothetical protein SLNWT_4270 [Streptomyces albus]|uniref:Uncharacterized protein n=1 Tax=Streptomyces albus (strain ATCC 21838 / DSM 41398 / FERM P-419 / JCM 4703 / NBRC 107858) TaxID=1081613 RepID=A0A0B5F175_STRA4|nr:hypothetical protein SLNWT_4270 [Streptomyces albus]AOU78954.1 hypothetical protein SLNHY_4263 [Streptomyces albus]AYN34689.1 hypothetical protein DUI70_4190 [Streptomyces albus]
MAVRGARHVRWVGMRGGGGDAGPGRGPRRQPVRARTVGGSGALSGG